MDSPPPPLHFDVFALDTANRQLRRDGVPVELGSRYFDALALLVGRPGELVSKDEFMRAVWQGVPVTDEALTQCIRTLRRALGDEPASPRFIQTVPKHGYRFIAEVSSAAAERSFPEASGAPVSMVAGATTLAGLAAGALAGLAYGILAGKGGGGQVLILAAMIGALGLLAGAGLGAGMAGCMAWRGRGDAWCIPAAALGGLCVGALGNLLGREGVGLLSGLAVGQVTGPFEGLLIGTATGCAGWAVFAGWSRGAVLAIGLVAGGLAGALIHLGGGTLLAGSLATLQQGLPGAQIGMERIGALIGEQGFTPLARAVTASLEAAVFVAAMAAGLLAQPRR